MAIDYTALGQRIADFRSKENLSQEELAFRCGVGNKHISNIELGKSKPSLECPTAPVPPCGCGNSGANPPAPPCGPPLRPWKRGT